MSRFATEEFFEDPVWRKARVIGISQHFITAFLDLHLKGMQDRQPFLALSPARSDDGVWPPATSTTGAYAAGQPGVTLWRGFQRRWAEGLEVRNASPAP
jgi:predicted pyridoxine 5'-phosphate oxidase superfamily flavin-nucleotide-binding protein